MAQLIRHRRYAFQAVHSLQHHMERRHGHQYALEVGFLEGAPWKLVDQCVQEKILSRLHAHEIDVVEQATGENIVNWIHEQLALSVVGPWLLSVALQETRKNRFVSARTELKYV